MPHAVFEEDAVYGFSKNARLALTKIVFVPNVRQPLVAFPAAGVDGTLRRNLISNDGLKRFGRIVRNQFGVNGTISLLNAEHRLFKRYPASFGGMDLRKFWWCQRNAY